MYCYSCPCVLLQKLLLELKNFEVNEKVDLCCVLAKFSGYIACFYVSLRIQVASGKDADVSSSDRMGVIPAGTLLKTEFSAIVPDATQAEKMQVGKYFNRVYGSNYCCSFLASHRVDHPDQQW